MGRPERPVDPAAGPIERLAWELRRLRNDAGRPSYRELARRAHFSRSTLAEVATGMRLPTLEATVAYAVACGGAKEEWQSRWRAAANELERSQLRCPYPGLAPLQTTDADLFFGRDALLGELRDAVRRAPLTAVFGASGSGKSSLLLAGLLPALSAEGTPAAFMTPGAKPLDELSDGLSASVVVIDQFEEVFTLCSGKEREAFLDELATLIKSGEQAFVLGVRSDFYEHCAQHPGLVTALREHVQLPIGPLSENDLREIVTAPAARVGLTVEASLVATVVAEAAEQPGALPLVAHTLRETWQRHPGQQLTLAAYQATGGVRESIARTAEQLYEELDDLGRQITRAVLTRLTALGDGTVDTRRRLGRDELTGVADPGEVDAVLDLLAARRLVVVGGDTIDLAHEAIIQAWPRLQSWLADDREALRRQHRLTAAAAEWDRTGRHPEFLYVGSRLAGWDGAPLNDLERAFLAAGRAHQAAGQHAAQRRRRLGLGGLGLAAAVVSVLVVLAMVQSGQTSEERDRASSRRLASHARAQLTADPELALLLAIKAYEASPTEEADLVLRQATFGAQLRQVLPTGVRTVQGMTATQDRRRVAIWGLLGAEIQILTWRGGRLVPDKAIFPPKPLSVIAGAALSADGRRFAAGLVDGTVQVWDLADVRAGYLAPPRVLRPNRGRLAGAVAFGPDGRLATAHGTEVWIWSLATRQNPVVLNTGEGSVTGLAFTSAGKLITSGTALQLWDLPSRRRTALRPGGQESLTVSPDGGWLAAARYGYVQLWDTRKGLAPHPDIAAKTAKGVAFSADGRRLATFHTDRRISVWTTGTDRTSLDLTVPGDRTAGTAFSPDGRTLISVDSEGSVRLWDVSTSEVNAGTALGGYPGMGTIAALSADGSTVAATTLDQDGVLRVWDTARGGTPIALPSRRRVVVALSPDGRWIAGGGADGTVRLLDLKGLPRGAQPHLLRTGSSAVHKVAFSPDGRLLAAAGPSLTWGGGVQVWRIPDQGPPAPLQGWYKAPDRSNPQAALAFSPNGRQLAGARDDHSVAVWDLTRAQPPRTLRGHRGTIGALAYSPDGRRLASVGEDGSIRLWNTTGPREPLAVIATDPSLGRTAVFSPDSSWLATNEPDGGIKLWRTTGSTTPLVLKGFGAAVTTLTYAPDGKHLTLGLSRLLSTNGQPLRTGLADQVVRTWQCEVCGPPAETLTLAKHRVTRPLTPSERRLYH